MTPFSLLSKDIVTIIPQSNQCIFVDTKSPTCLEDLSNDCRGSRVQLTLVAVEPN